MQNGNTTLVKQAKEERTALLAILEQKKYSEQLVKSEELINKKNYAEAKDILNKLVSETKDNKILKNIIKRLQD